MIFTTSVTERTSSVFSIGRRNGSRILRGSTAPPNQARVARAFYCDVLQGQQVWAGDEAREHDASLSFIVEGTRIDVNAGGASDGEEEPVVLSVPDPGAVAERCWDAGYSVRVGGDDESATEAAVSVIDPFGRRIDLVR
jgi:glyoxalase/bleomycin resistance protein/dioxygenase superfamily protein